ncbi:MAG: hypothetical protein JST11_03915 [Acidobacteria bacterium]|nr:hypothetical protein [Acidobacteriota bacterium]
MAVSSGAVDRSFLSTVHNLSTIATTVPANGDVNPYGVAVVPATTGSLVAGSVLVSNFNNSANLQGTGTTIVQVSPGGSMSLFATIAAGSLPGPCPGGVGLTTALVALRSGFVVVGSLPTTDGTAATARAGCLIILDNSGHAVATLAGHGINGPWDMTAADMGTGAVLFVTNVLNGTVDANGSVVPHGSVLRIVLSIPFGGTPAAASYTTIASAFGERTDPAALVVGPTGLALGGGTLYVADTLRNRIAAIPAAVSRMDDAGDGMTVAQGRALKEPLGLAIAPNGDIVTVNAANGLIVETTPRGRQRGVRFADVSHSGNGAGTLFGLAFAPEGEGVYLVNDGNNTLNILR